MGHFLRLLPGLFLLLSFTCLHGEDGRLIRFGDESIRYSMFSEWIPDSSFEYQGEYFIETGDSSSTLQVMGYADKSSEDGRLGKFVVIYIAPKAAAIKPGIEVHEELSLEGNVITSKEARFEFVRLLSKKEGKESWLTGCIYQGRFYGYARGLVRY